jgi:hypothetical protein
MLSVIVFPTLDGAADELFTAGVGSPLTLIFD